tara:strand:+ start:198 stop:509 length:312 start_codon:yes stop_codon:yes gene_type:complete
MEARYMAYKYDNYDDGGYEEYLESSNPYDASTEEEYERSLDAQNKLMDRWYKGIKIRDKFFPHYSYAVKQHFVEYQNLISKKIIELGLQDKTEDEVLEGLLNA